jgi:hypothetical protein
MITTAIVNTPADMIGNEHPLTLSAQVHASFTWMFDNYADAGRRK